MLAASVRHRTSTGARPPYPRGMGFWFNLAQFGLIGMQVLR